jgi:hypothetical protein
MSVHYIELAPSAFTLLGAGAIVYQGEETSKGGEKAVDFDKVAKGGDGQVFAKINLKNLPPGTYEWVRASVTYQNYDVRFNINNVPVVGNLSQQKGTVASFVGFNTYISTVTPRSKPFAVNDDKRQGFWVFETDLSAPYASYNQLYSGEAPAGATTVVNPLFGTSPIPPGSCVVTGKFLKPLVITGEERLRHHPDALVLGEQKFRVDRYQRQRPARFLRRRRHAARENCGHGAARAGAKLGIR